MTIHPVFVPVQGAQIAATISLPEGPARGLAVLLQGFGATRSHRNRLWTHTAAALAGRGIASLRLDYPGMGDSTGARLSMKDPPVAAVAAATRLALDVAAADAYAAVGNCLGARTALLLAGQVPACRGVGLILPGTFDGIVRTAPPHRGAVILRRIAHAVPPVRRLARRVAHGRADGSLHLLPEVESVLRSTSTLFLFMGSEQMWQRLVEGLAGPIRRAGRGAADRIERVHVPTVGSHGLQPLSSQEAVLRVVPDWVDRAISPEARSEASSPATPWAAGTSTGDVGVSARRK